MSTRYWMYVTSKFAVAVIAASAFAMVSYAETFDFKVAYAQGPVTDTILSGNLRGAIEILEKRRQDPDSHYVR